MFASMVKQLCNSLLAEFCLENNKEIPYLFSWDQEVWKGEFLSILWNNIQFLVYVLTII